MSTPTRRDGKGGNGASHTPTSLRASLSQGTGDPKTTNAKSDATQARGKPGPERAPATESAKTRAPSGNGSPASAPERRPYTMSPQEFFDGPMREALGSASPLRQIGGVIEFDIETDARRTGGTWSVDLDKGEVKPGESTRPSVILRAGALDFMALVEGRMSPSDGLVTERLAVSGDAVRIHRLFELLGSMR